MKGLRTPTMMSLYSMIGLLCPRQYLIVPGITFDYLTPTGKPSSLFEERRAKHSQDLP